MKISNNYPVLQKENAIMIVSGVQAGKIYRLRKGELVERESLEVIAPTYSDKEGFFMRRGHGKILGSGSVLESNDQHLISQYTKQLGDQLKGIKRPFDVVYLFVPLQVSNTVKDAIPKKIQKKIHKEFNGNFTNSHPSELLDKIRSQGEKAARKSAKMLVSGDAAKILRRGNRVLVGNTKKLR